MDSSVSFKPTSVDFDYLIDMLALSAINHRRVYFILFLFRLYITRRGMIEFNYLDFWFSTFWHVFPPFSTWKTIFPRGKRWKNMPKSDFWVIRGKYFFRYVMTFFVRERFYIGRVF